MVCISFIVCYVSSFLTFWFSKEKFTEYFWGAERLPECVNPIFVRQEEWKSLILIPEWATKLSCGNDWQWKHPIAD
jgi:hypothetical protein